MIGNFFNVILVWPITNVLVAIFKSLIFLHIPYALGFSIIVLTVLIRLLLYPLIASQLRASKKMQEVAPHVNKLKDKHKGDAKMLQQETMRLYKEHGVNPAAGCLPLLIQLPIIWALYAVLRQIVSLSSKQAILQINKVVYTSSLKLTGSWDQSFFGLPLGKTPGQLISTIGVLVLLVPIITGVFQFIQSKMMFAKIEPQVDKNKEKKEDFASAFQSQSLYIFPVMIAFFSYTFPIGLSLYWNAFTIFGIIQQYQISGLGGLSGLKKK
jgi:YidC/Oxa1 family membrane protein insertase